MKLWELEKKRGKLWEKKFCETQLKNTTEVQVEKAILAEKMEAPLLYDHVAMSLQNYVLVLTGRSLVDGDARYNDIMHCIWSYNLYTEQWRKYRIQESKSIPHLARHGATAVAIGPDVYMFGSHLSNNVWRLTIIKNRCFAWTKMPEKAKSETPSPRILSSQVVSLPFQSVIHPEDSSL